MTRDREREAGWREAKRVEERNRVERSVFGSSLPLNGNARRIIAVSRSVVASKTLRGNFCCLLFIL